MGWKAGNTPMETIDITILGEDISLVSERLNYATLGNGKFNGIQRLFEENNEEEPLLKEHLNATREHLSAINKIITREFYE